MGITRTLVTTMAYLLGVDDKHLDSHFDDQWELVEELKNDEDATIIRYLSMIRNTCLAKYGKINQAIRYDLTNLDRMEDLFDTSVFRYLEERGVCILKANGQVNDYISTCTGYINNRIGNCQKLFREWQHFELIKDLFKLPKGNTLVGITKAKEIYQKNYLLYPFGRYINWQPYEVGNILANDQKFMKFLCGLHGLQFRDYSRTRDVGYALKDSMYQQLKKEPSVWLVDCENCDVFKLAAVFDGMKDELSNSVKKIVLFDDVHASSAWDKLGAYCHLPIEHLETKRVLDGKSVVDFKLCMYCNREYYVEGSRNFVLCSSDSDYLTLMDGLPAEFMVLYEKEKMSNTALDTMREFNITSVCIDEFCTSTVEDFQMLVMKETVKNSLPELERINVRDIIRSALNAARMDSSESATNAMFQRFKKTMKFSINDDGTLVVAY